jgi:CheY-like chemotaxis protein
MKKKILMVDDDPLVVSTTKIGIENAGYKFITASNGADGFIMAKKEKPDLIIMDVMMPGENGLITLEKIEKDDELKKIPVIMSSNLEESRRIAKNHHAAGFILKAKSTIGEIVQKIEEILKK